MRLGYYLGVATKSVAKAALPVGAWFGKQAVAFGSEFTRGMTEQPTIIAKDDPNYHNAVRDETNNQVPTDIDTELKQAIHEPVQPELPGMNPEQPVRQS